MKPFKLIPSVSFSEKDFIESISKEKWKEIKDKIYTNHSGDCIGCGHHPTDIRMLQIHLNWWDEKDIETAEFVLVCEGCHFIKHFDVVIANDYAVLVNSVYSQNELMRRNRGSGTIKKDISENKIILLKKTPKEYYNEILESELNRNDKTKILFGHKFTWKK